MKYIVFHLFLFLLFIFAPNDELKAQKQFKLIHVQTSKEKEFRIGKKVMFQLKDSVSDSLITKGIVNRDSSIYELRLTGIQKQNLIFDKKIIIPYSDINWLFIHTSGRVTKQLSGMAFLGFLMPLYAGSDPRIGLFASIIFVPVSIIFFKSSERNFYYSSQWKLQSDSK